MATQKCPKCRSGRVRQGYRHTPLLMKMAFTYNLLCDECNWEFLGFAIPGTVTKKTKKKKVFRQDLPTPDNFDVGEASINTDPELDFALDNISIVENNSANVAFTDEDEALDSVSIIESDPLNSSFTIEDDDMAAKPAETDLEISTKQVKVKDGKTKPSKNKSKVKKKVRVKMH